MLGDSYDDNFLRYLTANVPLSVFEHRVLDPLQKRFSRDQLPLVLNGTGQAEAPSSRETYLYVSLPFCAQACSFCHCTYYVVKKRSVLLAYEDYLARQAVFFGSLSKGRKFSSIYIGGGTPSFFSEDALDRIFAMLFSHFDCSDLKAFMFEGHPATLGKRKLSLLAKRGVTRLTIGVQSLDRDVLKIIGRHQTEAQVSRCVEEAKSCGISFVNVDLVAGLPGQSLDSFCKGLKEVIAMRPDGIHVNLFSDILTSRCYRETGADFGALVLLRQQMMYAAKEMLKSNGYYRDGFEAWQCSKGADNVQQTAFLESRGDILGIGFGAQSNFYGRAIIRDMSIDTKSVFFLGCEVDEFYTMANYMIPRLLKGVTREDFWTAFGRDLQEVFSEGLSMLERAGMVRNDGRMTRYDGLWTPEGLFEYFSLVKVLLGKDLLDRLGDRHASSYDPSHVYTFAHDGFMPMMNDAFFLLTLYDTGY